MPKPNPGRSVTLERNLAANLRGEREARGWTLDQIAQRMTRAGCPMDRSAIHRIEQGRPPRRVTVDEAVTFASVLGIPLNRLLLPPEVFHSKQVAQWYKRWRAHREKFIEVHDQGGELLIELRGLLTDGAIGDLHAQMLDENDQATGEALARMINVVKSGGPTSPELLEAMDRLTDGTAADQ